MDISKWTVLRWLVIAFTMFSTYYLASGVVLFSYLEIYALGVLSLGTMLMAAWVFYQLTTQVGLRLELRYGH